MPLMIAVGGEAEAAFLMKTFCICRDLKREQVVLAWLHSAYGSVLASFVPLDLGSQFCSLGQCLLEVFGQEPNDKGTASVCVPGRVQCLRPP